MRKFTLGWSIVFITLLSFTKIYAQVPGSSCDNPILTTVNDDCSDGSATTYSLDFSAALQQGTVSCNTGVVYGYWFEFTVTESFSMRVNTNYDVEPVGMYAAIDCAGTEIDCLVLGGEYNILDIEPGTYHTLFWTATQSGEATLCFESVDCMEPQNIEANNISFYDADISWDGPNAANEFEWEVTEHGEPSIIIDSGTTSNENAFVTNLIDETMYHFKIRSSCSGSTYSDWVDYTFSTPPNLCEEPYNLQVTSSTNHEVTFQWNDDAGDAWYYDVRPTGSPAPSFDDTGIPTTSNPTTDSGLDSDTTYDLYIRTDCGDGSLSAWVVPPVTFTTLSDEAADWNNLQWPPDGTIDINTPFVVYAQIYEPGLTNAEADDFGAGISAWIGISTENTDPSTWTSWQTASYNTDVGNNDEFMADIGSNISVQGTYYYASRFQINNGYYTYGGLNGFWANDSGVLTVQNSLGIDTQDIEGFMMYPNPVKDNLSISAKNRIESVVIVNMLGQEIMKNKTNSTNLQLNTSRLPVGNYILKVQVDNQLGIYHFIKE